MHYTGPISSNCQEQGQRQQVDKTCASVPDLEGDHELHSPATPDAISVSGKNRLRGPSPKWRRHVIGGNTIPAKT